jgi:hypothetical protein
VTQLAQRPADKVGTEARFHATMLGSSRPNVSTSASRFDLTTKSNLAVRGKANNVEDLLADVDADRA